VPSVLVFATWGEGLESSPADPGPTCSLSLSPARFPVLPDDGFRRVSRASSRRRRVCSLVNAPIGEVSARSVPIVSDDEFPGGLEAGNCGEKPIQRQHQLLAETALDTGPPVWLELNAEDPPIRGRRRVLLGAPKTIVPTAAKTGVGAKSKPSRAAPG